MGTDSSTAGSGEPLFHRWPSLYITFAVILLEKTLKALIINRGPHLAYDESPLVVMLVCMCVFVCVLLPSSALQSNSSAAKCENLLMHILFHYYFYFLHSLCGDIVQSLQIGCPPFYTGCVSTKVEDRRQRTVSLRCMCRRNMLKKHFRPELTVM